MTNYIVDTNVAVIANGRDGNYHLDCRMACVEQIERLRTQTRHRVVLDSEGLILEEYHRYLNPHGQPGVGDYFYRHLLNFRGNRKRVIEVDLPKDPASGEYADFPNTSALKGFDPADRKFLVAAIVGNATVLYAIERGWVRFKAALRQVRVKTKELCPTRSR